MKTLEEIKKEAVWRFTDGHGATEQYAVEIFTEACKWCQESTPNLPALREKFFAECTDQIYQHREGCMVKKINLAPHDMFEWIVKNFGG